MRPAVSDHLKKNVSRGFKSVLKIQFRTSEQSFHTPGKAIEYFRQFGLLKNLLQRKLSSTQTLLLNYFYSIDASFTLTLKSN